MEITISGKPGSGKTTVGKLVAKKLKLKFYSEGEFQRKLARQLSISIIELNKISERSKNYDKILDQRQIDLGVTQDNFLLDSRLGWYFIPDAVKIFLDVKLDEAAKRIFHDKKRKAEKNIDIKITKKNIKQRIKLEKEKYKQKYNLNPYLKKHYDLYLDTTKLLPERVAEKIIKFVKKKIKQKR